MHTANGANQLYLHNNKTTKRNVMIIIIINRYRMMTRTFTTINQTPDKPNENR